MKVAVLVIAAVDRPVWVHHLRAHWVPTIRFTNRYTPDVDVYLLVEHGTPRTELERLDDNVIEDPDPDVDRLVDPRFRTAGIPGILAKTIHALDRLADDYDAFFRTNLSSLVKLERFETFIRSRDRIGYAGALVWSDALRENLTTVGLVGPDRRVRDIAELDVYPGNTFLSGSGFFLGAAEARLLVEQRDRLRYDLPDDVAIGLMLDHHEPLPGFSMIVSPDELVEQAAERIRSTAAAHIRLQHFPVERAAGLWYALRDDPPWTRGVTVGPAARRARRSQR